MTALSDCRRTVNSFPLAAVIALLRTPMLWIGVLSGFAAGGFILLCALVLISGWRDAERQGDEAAANMADIIAHDTGRTFELYDLSLQGVIRALAIPETARLTGKARRLALFSYTTNATYLNAISIIDENGKVIENSRALVYPGLNFSDRDYFRIQKDDPNIGMYVSRPMRSRVQRGEWTIAISRRIDKPDGSFGGVVVGTLNLAYFESLFSHLSLGTNGSVAIFRSDGALIARKPFTLNDIGRNFGDAQLFRHYPMQSAGHYYSSSAVDGIARRFTFRQVGNLPLVVTVGMAVSDIYAPWRQKALLTGTLMTSLVLVIFALWVALSRELARRKQTVELLRESESRYQLLAENSNDAIVLRTLEGKRKYATSAFYRIIGRSPDEMKNKRLVDFLDDESRTTARATSRRLRAGERRVVDLLRYKRPDDTVIWLERVSSAVVDSLGRTEIVTNIRDVTPRKVVEDKLAVAAATDGLTGLANRRCFDETLLKEWNRACRLRRKIAVLMIDVDHFKAYNDAFGHLTGDEALQLVATCIDSQVRRPTDLAARYGGEEFAVILPDTDADGATFVAEKIRTAVSELNFSRLGRPIGSLTLSIGVKSMQPKPDESATSLIGGADAALYRAKQNGRNRTEGEPPEAVRTSVSAGA